MDVQWVNKPVIVITVRKTDLTLERSTIIQTNMSILETLTSGQPLLFSRLSTTVWMYRNLSCYVSHLLRAKSEILHWKTAVRIRICKSLTKKNLNSESAKRFAVGVSVIQHVFCFPSYVDGNWTRFFCGLWRSWTQSQVNSPSETKNHRTQLAQKPEYKKKNSQKKPYSHRKKMHKLYKSCPSVQARMWTSDLLQ